MKTTKAESPDLLSAPQKGGKRSNEDLDPDFDIEVTGGPSDGSGDSNTRPIQPPKA